MEYVFENPIEMPRGSHYGSDYWIAYSYKLKRIAHLYSILEYANFITLEMNYKVKYFCEQPVKIEDINNSIGKKSSVLDFWVQYINGSCEFQEIKYSTDLVGTSESSIRSQKQVEFQRNWCLNNNYNYSIVTEKDLYTGQFIIQNLELLHSHLLNYNQMATNLPENLIKILCDHNLTISEIQSLQILPEKYELSILAHQYYKGNIDIVNLKDRPLDQYSEVKLCEKKDTIS